MSCRADTMSTDPDSLQFQAGNDLARLPRVVPAQTRQLTTEGATFERLDDPGRPGVGAPFLWEHQIESLLGQRDEVEPVGDGGAARDDAGVGCPHGDGLRHLQVATEKPLVASDGGGWNASLPQQPIEEAARSGSRLPIDEADFGPGNVFQLANPPRIPLGDGEALFEV